MPKKAAPRKSKANNEHETSLAATKPVAGSKHGVQDLIAILESKLRKESKVSFADYIRLVQLERAMEDEDEKPSEILVKWVDETDAHELAP